MNKGFKMKFFGILPITGLLCCALVNAAGIVPQGQHQAFAEGPKCPLDDPLLRPERAPINVTMDPITGFTEDSWMEDLTLTGLSTLRYNFSIQPLLLTASFELTVGKLEGMGKYNAAGYVDARPLPEDTAPSGNFTGNGDAHFLVEGVSFKGSAKVIINLIGNKVQLTELTLTQVVFDKMVLHFEGYTIGGNLMDWEVFNGRVKQNFDRDWPTHRSALQEKIKQAANNYVGKYTLAELIDLIENGSGDCEE